MPWAAFKIIFVFIVPFAANGFGDSATGSGTGGFDFFPEYHLNGEAIYFFNHQNQAYRTEYLMETNSDLELDLLSYNHFLYWVWELQNRLGAGRQNQIITFNPYESRYAVNPLLEFRTRPFNFQAGIEHPCFHNIDRLGPLGETYYWNKIRINVNTKNFRLGDYRQGLTGEEKGKFISRFSGGIRIGYFLKDLGGLVDTGVLNGGHSYFMDGGGEARYAFYLSRRWIVNARLGIDWKRDRAGNFYQAYVPGLEGHPLFGKGGFAIFVYYNAFDNLPLRPRNKLVEFGIRFYL
jgi:hypothetical protein